MPVRRQSGASQFARLADQPLRRPAAVEQRELKFRRAPTVDQRVARGGKKRGIAENPDAVRYHPRLTGHDSLFGIEGHGHQRAIPHEQQLAVPDRTRHIAAAEGRRDQSLRALAIWQASRDPRHTGHSPRDRRARPADRRNDGCPAGILEPDGPRPSAKESVPSRGSPGHPQRDTSSDRRPCSRRG